MLYEIKDQFSIDMISDEEGPHISLYQPTHSHYPENKQDSIVFKNLLREIENSLKQKNEPSFIDSIMEPFYKLEKDSNFWNNTFDGIAILANQNKCIIYKLTGTIKEFAVVNKRFHIKPLIKAFQSVGNYQLLLLSKNDFSIYQGNRYGFSEIEIDSDIPRTLEAVLGKQLTDPSVTQGSFAGVGRPGAFYGLGDNKVEGDKDTEKYFRYVDQYVYDNHSKTSKLPLILVSLKEYHTQFKTLSNNIYFIDESIDCSYDLVDTEQLQSKVLEVIKSLNLGKTEKMIEAYKKAEAELMGSSDLAQVAKAAYESRVETILIEENRIISGKVDSTTGKIKVGDIDNPDFGDILDGLAELVLKKGGNAVIISKDKMPSPTGIAAIYRYN
ncbi:MAG: hypothetical protein JJE03_07480 [Peptostreptococcaceae bacterium]|nr:hypothetical protein [Peptostreptococcaceae bacterium]